MRISDWSSDVCSSDLVWTTRWRCCRAAPKPTLLPTKSSPRWGTTRCSGYPSSINGDVQAELQGKQYDENDDQATRRSEERRVGKECVRTVRSGGSPYNSKKK